MNETLTITKKIFKEDNGILGPYPFLENNSITVSEQEFNELLNNNESLIKLLEDVKNGRIEMTIDNKIDRTFIPSVGFSITIHDLLNEKGKENE